MIKDTSPCPYGPGFRLAPDGFRLAPDGQKLDYLHNNPVESGFTTAAENFLYSSAMDYGGIKGIIEIELIA